MMSIQEAQAEAWTLARSVSRATERLADILYYNRGGRLRQGPTKLVFESSGGAVELANHTGLAGVSSLWEAWSAWLPTKETDDALAGWS